MLVRVPVLLEHRNGAPYRGAVATRYFSVPRKFKLGRTQSVRSVVTQNLEFGLVDKNQKCAVQVSLGRIVTSEQVLVSLAIVMVNTF